LMWRGARFLFPGFVHDVVWNHALCTMKEDVERGHDHAGWGRGVVPPSPPGNDSETLDATTLKPPASPDLLTR